MRAYRGHPGWSLPQTTEPDHQQKVLRVPICIDEDGGQRCTEVTYMLWRATCQFKELKALLASTRRTASVSSLDLIVWTAA